MILGVLSDEINRSDFAAAVDFGLSLGIRHYEVRSTANGRLAALAADGYHGVLTIENHTPDLKTTTMRNVQFVRGVLNV